MEWINKLLELFVRKNDGDSKTHIDGKLERRLVRKFARLLSKNHNKDKQKRKLKDLLAWYRRKSNPYISHELTVLKDDISYYLELKDLEQKFWYAKLCDKYTKSNNEGISSLIIENCNKLLQGEKISRIYEIHSRGFYYDDNFYDVDKVYWEYPFSLYKVNGDLQYFLVVDMFIRHGQESKTYKLSKQECQEIESAVNPRTILEPYHTYPFK